MQITMVNAALLLGIGLIIVAAFGGGIEVREVKIPPLTFLQRSLVFVVGLCLVGAAYWDPGHILQAEDNHSVGPTNQADHGGPTPVQKSLWNQDGSSVFLEANGPGRKFYYDEPTELLKKAGAKSGSPLFEGAKEQQKYVGTAYSYANGCQPLGYDASGDITDDDTKVTLRGSVPVRDSTCRKTGEQQEAVLVFTYRGHSDH